MVCNSTRSCAGRCETPPPSQDALCPKCRCLLHNQSLIMKASSFLLLSLTHVFALVPLRSLRNSSRGCGVEMGVRQMMACLLGRKWKATNSHLLSLIFLHLPPGVFF